MTIKRILLFCGALWVIARFAFFYLFLSLEFTSQVQSTTGLFLFPLGSVCGVMAVAYIMAGSFTRYASSYRKLLIIGQIFALFGDLATFFPGTASIGINYFLETTFLTEIPIGVSLLGVIFIDFLFLLFLLLSQEVASGDPGKEKQPKAVPLPKPYEIVVDEED